MVSGTAAAASRGNLLRNTISHLHPMFTDSETIGVNEAQQYVFYQVLQVLRHATVWETLP